MPPIEKPVRSRTQAASARSTGSPRWRSSSAGSTRLAPPTSASTGSPEWAPRNTSDLTICRCWTPSAAAASAAVRAESASTRMRASCPRSASACATRRLARGSFSGSPSCAGLSPIGLRQRRTDIVSAPIVSAAASRSHPQDRRGAAGLRVDRVRGVGGVRLAVGRVGAAAVDRVAEPVVEEQLAGVDDAAADVDLDVDVRRAAAVPAGVDRVEDGEAVRVGALVAAQEAQGVRRRGVAAGAAPGRAPPPEP